jgi:heme exporter protein CcmD
MLFCESAAADRRHRGGLMNEFLNMGGYAGYVWPAYGLSLVGLLGLAFAIWRRGRTLRNRLRKLERARESGATRKAD